MLKIFFKDNILDHQKSAVMWNEDKKLTIFPY